MPSKYLQVAACILVQIVAFSQTATLNGKPVKHIRISPTISHYEVTHLVDYVRPEIRQNANKELFACNRTETPGVHYPEEGAAGEIISMNLNGCSSITDDLCTYDIYDREEFNYQIVFRAGGVSNSPRFITEGSYTVCGWFMCLSLWVDLIPEPIKFTEPLIAGEYYGVSYNGILDLGNKFETPSYTFETWAVVGDFECSWPEYDDNGNGAGQTGINYDECNPERCMCVPPEYDDGEGEIGTKVFEEWVTMETCFKTMITYHETRI